MSFFESRLVVAELSQSKLDVLQESSHKEYEAHLAMFDPTRDDVKSILVIYFLLQCEMQLLKNPKMRLQATKL